jgi:hypothetical protein
VKVQPLAILHGKCERADTLPHAPPTASELGRLHDRCIGALTLRVHSEEPNRSHSFGTPLSACGPLVPRTYTRRSRRLSGQRSQAAITRSLDHLVGAGEHGRGHVEAERLGGLEVDDQLVLGRRLHRKIGWFLASQDAIDVAGREPVLVDPIRSIGDEAASAYKMSVAIDCGQLVPSRQCDDRCAMH